MLNLNLKPKVPHPRRLRRLLPLTRTPRPTLEHDPRLPTRRQRRSLPGTRGPLPSPQVPPRPHLPTPDRRPTLRDGRQAHRLLPPRHRPGLGRLPRRRHGLHPGPQAPPTPGRVRRRPDRHRLTPHRRTLQPRRLVGRHARPRRLPHRTTTSSDNSSPNSATSSPNTRTQRAPPVSSSPTPLPHPSPSAPYPPYHAKARPENRTNHRHQSPQPDRKHWQTPGRNAHRISTITRRMPAAIPPSRTALGAPSVIAHRPEGSACISPQPPRSTPSITPALPLTLVAPPPAPEAL